jgi:hypothetical protein
MSVAQVRKLYPGGVAKKRQNGETDYYVVKSVGPISTALVEFGFGPTDGLNLVTIIFPEQDSDVDLKAERFLRTTTDVAKRIWNLTLDAMKSKYGDYREGSDSLMWRTLDDDFITLENKIDDPSHSTVIINYSKYIKKPSTEGL